MPNALLSVPVIVKVLVALGLILLISRFTRHLVVAVGAATLVLGVWCGWSGGEMARIAWAELASANNLMLMLAVVQVIWLSSQMAATGVMEDLVRSVRSRVSRHASMAVLPAVIGLLPMPGGALFSAPLVDSVDAAGEVAPSLKAQTNHWFRHIWEYWWPLYPGVLLAAEESHLQIWQFMLLQFPFTLMAVAVGTWFLLRRIGGGSDSERPQGAAPGFLRLVLPIIIVIACYAAIRVGHAVLSAGRATPLPLNQYLPMCVGLFAAMGVLQVDRPLPWAEWRPILLSGRTLAMLLIVAAVRVYGAFIEADLPGGVALAGQMRSELLAWGVPFVPVIMVLGFLSGLSTGLTVGFVGASFPIVMGMIGQAPTAGTLLSTVVLAFGFGYMGMLVSPVHVCLVVTSKHFETELLHNAAALMKPGAVMLALVTAAYFLLRALVP